jgi:hypothetical protein
VRGSPLPEVDEQDADERGEGRAGHQEQGRELVVGSLDDLQLGQEAELRVGRGRDELHLGPGGELAGGHDGHLWVGRDRDIGQGRESEPEVGRGGQERADRRQSCISFSFRTAGLLDTDPVLLFR